MDSRIQHVRNVGLEALEPRLLLSADPLAELFAPADDVVTDFARDYALIVSMDNTDVDSQGERATDEDLFNGVTDEALPAATGTDADSGEVDEAAPAMDSELPMVIVPSDHSYSDYGETLLTGPNESTWTRTGELVTTLNAANAPPALDSAWSAVLEQARSNWSPYINSAELSERLSSITFTVTDLPAGKLGQASGLSISLDTDAAGHGWYVDPTPASHDGFTLLDDGTYRGIDGVDLLTVAMHEIGHVLGLEDNDSAVDAGIMGSNYSPGSRILPDNLSVSADAPLIQAVQYLEVTEDAAEGLADGIAVMGFQIITFINGEELLGERMPILLQTGEDTGGINIFESPTLKDLLSLHVDTNGDGYTGTLYPDFAFDPSDEDEQDLDAFDTNGDDWTDAGEFLNALLFVPLVNYLNSHPATTEDIVDFLEGSGVFDIGLDRHFTDFRTSLTDTSGPEVHFNIIDINTGDTTEDPDAELTFVLSFELSVTQDMPIDLGLDADALRIFPFTGDWENAGQVEVPVTTTLGFRLEFGIYTGGQTPDDVVNQNDFFIRWADPLTITAESNVSPLDFHMHVGFLGTEVTGGSLTFNATVNTDLIDANDPDLLGFSDAQFGIEHAAGYVTGNSAIPSYNLEHDVGFFLRIGNLGESTPVLVPAGEYGSKAALQDAINGALEDAEIDHLVFAVIDGVDHLSFGLWPTLTSNPLGMGNETISSSVLPYNAIGGNGTYEYGSNVTFLLSENGEVPGVVSLRFPDPSESDIGFSENLTASLLDDLEADLIANSIEFGGDALFTLRVRFTDGTYHEAQVNVTKVSTSDNLSDTDKLVVDLQDALDAASFTHVTAGQSGGYLYISGDSTVAGMTLLSLDSVYAETGLGFYGPKAVTVQLTGAAVGNPDFDDGDAYTEDTAVFQMSTNNGSFTTYVISAEEARDLTGLISDINAAISGTGVEAVESAGRVRLKATSDAVWAIEILVKNQDMDDLVADLQRSLDYAGLPGINALNSGGNIWLQGSASADVLEISGTLTFDAGITFTELLVPAEELFDASEGGASTVQILLPVTVKTGLEDATTGADDDFQVTDARLVANFDPFNSDKAEYDEVENRFRLIFTYDPYDTVPTAPAQDVPAGSVPGPGGVTNEIRLVNFGELLNFSILNAESMIGLISSLGTALQQLSKTDVFRDYEIPFADANLSQFLNFADSDKDNFSGLIDMLLFDTGGDGIDGSGDVNRLLKKVTVDGTSTLLPTYSTAQTLTTRLNDLLGPGMIEGAYNSDTNELTYQFILEGYSRTILTNDLVPFEFNVPLDPFSKLATDSSVPAPNTSVSISGRTGLSLTMGVDLSPPGFAIFDDTTFDELNGEDGLDFLDVKAVTFPAEFYVPRLIEGVPRDYVTHFSDDVTFYVEIPGDPAVEVVIPGPQNNYTIEDLVLATNYALEDAGLDAVLVADYDSSTPPDGSAYDTARLVIVALDPTTEFTIYVQDAYSQNQLGYTVIYPAVVDDVAVKADFIIQTRDGVEHLVSIDDVSAPTVGDLISYLNTIAPASFGASYNFLHSGLRLVDLTGGTGDFQVSTVNGSEALLGLGLFLTSADLLPPPAETDLEGDPDVIEGGNIGLTSLDGRFFVRNTEMLLGLSLSTANPGTGVPGEGLYGIVGVDVHVDGSLSADISAGIADPGGPKNQVTLEELMNQEFTLYPAMVEGLLSLDYDNEASLFNFAAGDVLIGADPGDIAIIASVTRSGSTGTLLLSNVTGTFSDTESIYSISDSHPTVTATVSGTPEPDEAFGSFDLVVQVQEGFDDLGFDSEFKTLDDAPYTIPFEITKFGDPYGPTQPSTGGLNLSLLNDLEPLDDYDYDSIRRLVEGLLNVVLDVDTNFTELNTLLPAINRSVGQLLDLKGAFERGAANMEDVLVAAEFAIGPEGYDLGLPALRLQDVPQALRGAFGLPDGVDPYGGGAPVNYVKLVYDTGSTELLLSMNLRHEVSTKLGLDIVTGPDSPNLTSAGVLEVEGALEVHLDTATDLNSPADIYLLDSSYIGGGIHVQGEGQDYDIPGGQKGLGLVFRSNVGPLSVFIKDGDVLIDFAFILPGLDFGGSGRMPLDTVDYDDWNTRLILSDEIEIVLPMFYGGEGPDDFIGEYAASGAIAGVTVIEPEYDDIVSDITLEVVPYDPFENILLAIDTLDLYLELLSDDLAGEVLGIKLPFISDQLADILFIEDFRRALTRTLKNGIENAVDPDPDTIIEYLINTAFTGSLAGYLVAGPVQSSYLDLPQPVLPENRYREWTFTIGRTGSNAQIITIDDFDIGPDHLLFDVDAPLTVTLDWTIEITIGVDFGNGAYIDVSDPDDVDINVMIELPGTGPYDGELGFLGMDVTDTDGHSGADLVFAVDVKNGNTEEARLGFADIGSLNPEATLTGYRLGEATYSANYHLVSKTVSILPALEADFIFDWALPTTDVEDLNGDAVTPGIQVIKLDNMELDALHAVRQILGEPLERIAEFIEPFMPVIDILTAEIPILSDLAGEPFTLIDLAGLLSDDVDTRFIEAVADILKLIGEIGELGEGALPKLPLGSFVLYDSNDPGNSYFDPDPVTGSTLGADPISGDPGLTIDPAFHDLISDFDFLSDLGSGNLVDGLTMPIFDPNLGAEQVINLLVNRTATLIEYELPPLSVGFEYLQVFPVWGPLAVSIEINFSFTLDLHAVGFDTYGFQRYAQTGFRNAALILDGFYFADGESEGSDDPEITFQFGLVGAAELNLVVARGGVGGGVNALITFDWHDSVADGHVHISEIYGNILQDGVLGAFDVGGKLTFELFAFLEISILGIEEQFPITPEITLLDFGVEFDRLPKLGTVEGGVLYLNMGLNAKDRLNGDTSDGNESISVRQTGDHSFTVWSTDLGVGEGDLPDYTGVHEIVAYGGEGNDTIKLYDFSDYNTVFGYIDGGVGDDEIVFDNSTVSVSEVGFTIVGGLGNDTLKGSAANDVIYGNEGNDTVWGNGGYDVLFGDDGRLATSYISSRIHESDGVDNMDGGKGDDIVIGAGGSDILHGGDDTDLILGDGGRFEYTTTGGHIDVAGLLPDPYVPVPISNYVEPDIISAGIDAVEDAVLDRIRAANLGVGGNDEIYGDGGNDLVFGGTGDDDIEGNDGDDILLGGKGFDKISGGANSDSIYGGDQADVLYGNDGDDVMAGGSGNDFMHGDANDDVMKGDTGADVMFGDGGSDQVFGQTEPDLLFGGIDDDLVVGGSSNDIMFGDDGLVAKLATDLDPTVVTIGIGNPALVVGEFHDQDIRTLDLIITDVVNGDGNDILSGDAGDDIMLGGGGNDLFGGDVDPRLPSAGTDTEVSEDVMIGDGGKVSFNERRFRTIETIIGTETDDAVTTGYPFNDIMYGDNGNDYIFGGRGSDFIFGGHGTVITDVNSEDPDIFLGSFRGATDPGAPENDIIVGDNGIMEFADGSIEDNFGHLERVKTTDSVDITGGHEYADGEIGNDVIFGGVNGSVDILFGNVGDDVILGDNGEIEFSLDPNNDLNTIDLIRSYRDGLGGTDIVSGNAGNDVLIGGTDGDEMYGDDATASAGLDDGEDIMLGDNGDVWLINDDDYNFYSEDPLLNDINEFGRLYVQVAASEYPTCVDLITTTDDLDLGDPDFDELSEVEAVGGPDTMSGNARADIMIGGINGEDGVGDPEVDTMYGDIATTTGTTITNDSDDILLGDNGLLDFTFDPVDYPEILSPPISADTDRLTLDLIHSFEDALGGTDLISGNKGLDVAIGGTGDDTIYGDDESASAAGADLADLLMGDNADLFLVDVAGASGGDLKVVLDAAVMKIVTTDEAYDPNDPELNTGGVDTISGNAGGDTIAGGVEGDFLYGDRPAPNPTTTANDGDDIILGDNGAFEWLSNGRLAEISGINIDANNADLWTKYGAAAYDDDLTTLDLITTEQPNNGGRDLIYGDEGNDLVFAGTDSDTIYGDDGNESGTVTNNDVIFGDHGRIYPQYDRFQVQNSIILVDTEFLVAGGFPSRNYFAIDTGDTHGGEGDRMWGEEGNDIMVGQQGDDRMWGGTQDDDMIGGHNVAGGYDELSTPAISASINPDMNDLMDGGADDDAMAGDNAIIWRRGDSFGPRFRELTGDAIYTTGPDMGETGNLIVTNIGVLHQQDELLAVGRDVQLLDHHDDVETSPEGRFGADVMAGGSEHDVLYGQLGDDLMQGDGSVSYTEVVGVDEDGDTFITYEIEVADTVDPDETLFFNVPEGLLDGNDYLEGNGGDDLLFGGLGQDDIIGGSSSLFGLDTVNAVALGYTDVNNGQEMRPDGSDIIFGGAGIDISRNDLGDASIPDPVESNAIITEPTGHAHDSDFIMADNANIYRLVVTDVNPGAGTLPTPTSLDPYDPDTFLEFNYDQSYDTGENSEDRGSERIVVRAMEQLDYTRGGADYAGGMYINGAANLDNGEGDLVHGEAGDDVIFGMTGSDVLYGDGQDDDVIGGYGNDWISGGTGQDGVLGDDGLVLTSRNSIEGEPLNGIAGLLSKDASPKYSNGDAIGETISTPGDIQIAVINVEGALKKSVDLVPFSMEAVWNASDDEFPDDNTNTPYADDIIFGGLGSDWLHGGSGDDGISGAEALPHAYVTTFDGNGDPDGVLDLGYDVVAALLSTPVLPGDLSGVDLNPGDVLAFNPVDVDGQHLNNRYRAGEFFYYDEYDPRRKLLLVLVTTDPANVPIGSLYKGQPEATVVGEFLLNFDESEGVIRAEGEVLDAHGQETENYPLVNDDGKDAIFGDNGNDWLVGGTGRDNIYGGWGNDLLNADDDHDGHSQDYDGLPVPESDDNDVPDTHPNYEDRAYGGAGRDVLIGNTGGDRLIDWVGEYNSYLVPYAPFGQASVSRTLQPFLPEFLYALSAGDGADPTRYVDAVNEMVPEPTKNSPNPSRNGEPHGELGLVLQKDFAWQDQTGAPADPQAGNIPGGHRDVLRTASFGDGTSDGFFAETGIWEVTKGAYYVEPVLKGSDALSLFYVDEYVPTYFEVMATLNPAKPTGGYKSNAYVVFDYQSETDFKFAGINVSTSKLEVGQRTEEGWIVDVQGTYPGSLKANTNYNVFLAMNGSTVTLVVDGKVSLTHTFAPRVDYFGIAHGLNEGMIGLGANNSKSLIDNVTVQRLAPVLTFNHLDDLNGGTSELFLVPESGTWVSSATEFIGNTVGDPTAITEMSLPVSPAALVRLTTELSTEGEGGFVFDYYGPQDYKFLTLSADTGEILIGHRTHKGAAVDASYAKNKLSEGELQLTLKGSTVSVVLDGDLVLSYAFNALVTDGARGIVSHSGATHFDWVLFQTDDPSYSDGIPDYLQVSSTSYGDTFLRTTGDFLTAAVDTVTAVMASAEFVDATSTDTTEIDTVSGFSSLPELSYTTPQWPPAGFGMNWSITTRLFNASTAFSEQGWFHLLNADNESQDEDPGLTTLY